VHHTKDKLPSQTKRKFRKRGKIQKNNEGNTIFLKGDTVRGSLHLDTYYGAIAKDKDNNVAKDNKGNIVPNYVLRKELQKLKKTDVANIIDKGIRTTVEEAVKDHLIVFSKNGAKIKDDAIWQNKNKQIPIKKIRIYAPTVKSPLRDFKKHSEPFLSKKGYKQQFNVVNEENYCMAIYEGLNEKGKLKRNFEIINNLDAGNYFKKSNSEHRQDHKITPLLKLDLPLKYILKKGVMVLMYEKSPDEIWELVATDRVKRLYKLAKFDAQGRLSFRPHSEGKAASELKEVYSIDFDNLREQVRLQVSKLNLIVENIHFSISISGKIEKI
jgi:CRISPR-associated endonuclease Csn1